MSDSLSIINEKLDSLIAHTDKINSFVLKQEQDPLMHYDDWVAWVLVLLSIASVYFISKNANRIDKFYKKKGDRARNLWWTLTWVGISIIIIIGFFKLGLLHSDKPVYFSHADLFLIIATIIAIVGAVWAVYARIDAERAFVQSKKTYDALGTMFDFTTFFEKDKLQKIYDEIGVKDSYISLYLGFPIVGLPFERRNELDIKPEELFLKLKEKLEHFKNKLSLPNATPFDFSLYIGYININQASIILDDILSNDPLLKDVLSNHLKEFYKIIDYFYPFNTTTKTRTNISDKIRFIELELKEKFRYVTFKKVEEDVSSNKKTFVWVVDFKENSIGNLKPFDSKIFQTQDERFLGLLENIFK